MAKHFEREFEKLKTVQDRFSDAITGFAGSMRFVYLHSAWFLAWVILNIGLLGAGFIFDRYPFGLLTLIVSLEAIFLSTFVMISQNRQAARGELRSQLDYETDLKAEKEIELIMATLRRVAEKMGVDVTDLVRQVERLHEEEMSLISKEGKEDGDKASSAE